MSRKKRKIAVNYGIRCAFCGKVYPRFGEDGYTGSSEIIKVFRFGLWKCRTCIKNKKYAPLSGNEILEGEQ